MTKKERYKGIIDYFSSHFEEAQTELNYTNPYELLVAVILSAQCTDKRVNMITPKLFEHYPDAHTLSKANPEDVFQIIRSISYPNNKSKHLVGMANILNEKFDGKVPCTHEDLQSLPGVGRKTANVILSVIYNQPTMAVDTHVFRVSKRLGLVPQTAKTPLAVENELVKNIDKKLIPKAHHWLILHGRYVCTAKKPHCAQCNLKKFCSHYQKNNLA